VLYQSRDRDINFIKARKKHKCYGMGLGVMILDDVYPGFPGDVRNASAFDFPIQYEVIKGVDNLNLMHEEDKTPLIEPIVDAARNLEDMGCRAVVAECGYFAWFQKEVAGSVNVPVYMSSLLQVPLIQQVIGPKKDVGILCAEKNCLTDAHLQHVGIDLSSNYFIHGTQDDYVVKDFENLWDERVRPEVPSATYKNIEDELVAIVKDIANKYPHMGALMLECTGMQPFARAIQREIDIPVFSWGTLLELAYSSAVHRDYYGHV